MALPDNQVMTEEIETTAQSIFSTTMSPFCPGRLLNDCPSSKATDLKNTIRSELQTGASTESIKASLVQQFGEEVMATPAFSGFALFAWSIPILFLIIGTIVYRKWLHNSESEEVD